MVRFHWHVDMGFSAFVPPGGMTVDEETGVWHVMCEMELAGQNETCTSMMTVPPNYLDASQVKPLGLVLAHGGDAEEWKGTLLTAIATHFAKQGERTGGLLAGGTGRPEPLARNPGHGRGTAPGLGPRPPAPPPHALLAPLPGRLRRDAVLLQAEGATAAAHLRKGPGQLRHLALCAPRRARLGAGGGGERRARRGRGGQQVPRQRRRVCVPLVSHPGAGARPRPALS